jgi:hypothetical protein
MITMASEGSNSESRFNAARIIITRCQGDSSQLRRTIEQTEDNLVQLLNVKYSGNTRDEYETRKGEHCAKFT